MVKNTHWIRTESRDNVLQMPRSCFGSFTATPISRGCRLICRTHQHKFQRMLKLANAVEKLSSWLLLLNHDFKIIHQAGLEHQKAAILSRLATTEVENTDLEAEKALMEVTRTGNHQMKSKCVLLIRPPKRNVVPRIGKGIAQN